MKVADPTNTTVPSGPMEAFDLNPTESTFNKLVAWVGQYGDVFSVTPVKRKSPSVVINHPDYVKHVLVSNHENYVKGSGFEVVKMLLGNGIIVSDGPFWRRQRRMVQPAFNRQVIARLAEQMKEANRRLFETWNAQVDSGAEINITEATNELALEIILRAIFSDDYADITDGENANPFAILTDDSARDLQLAVKFRALTKIVLVAIEKRRSSGVLRDDFLSIFMAARDKDTNEAMTDKELVDEVMTLVVAGSETSATTMNWAWYLLAQHPDVEARLHQEVDAAAFQDVPDFEDAMTLTYTRQVIEETLRLYPPVWLYSRKAVAADHLGGYDIEPGTEIVITPYFLHRHPAFWPDAERFDPDRFSPEAIKQRHKFAFIPFSAGPRRCIGDFFGMVEVQIHLGLMARHFRLSLQPDQQVELAPEVNLRSKHPIRMQLHRR